jgi:hypothetical protein
MVTINHNRSQSRDRVLTFERDYPERLTGCSDYYGIAAMGAYELEKKMDEKLIGLVRHAMGTVGMLAVWMGWTDDATWMTFTGAVMAFVPFVWSWMSKPSV